MTLQFLSVVFIIVVLGESGSSEEPIKSKFTPTEKYALEKFRPLVKDALYRDYMNEDYYLITFLRAKNMNFQEGVEMLRQAHKWRLDNKIDGILKEDMGKLHKSFKYFSDATDYEGRPVITWDYGRWDIRRMSVTGSMPMLVRYLDRLLEDAITKVREQRALTGKDVTQYVMILDGYGFSLRTHGCVTCLPFYYAFITHTDLYYPQTGHAVHLINIPRVFDNVFALIRPIMSPQIRDVINLYGFDSADWKKKFEKTIPLDQIRKQFGGTRENEA